MKIYTIGRGESNTIHVDNEFVSRQHALLKVYPSGKMEIVDRSSNGTSINGRKLKQNVSYKVRRKDVVTFAGQVQLDWKEIPDPVKGYKIAGLCLLILAVLAGGFFIARPYLFKTSGGGSYGGGGGGGGAVPPATTQPADTVKGGIEGTNVDEVLKKMTEEEKRKKREAERKKKKKEEEAKKKAEEEKKVPADTASKEMKLGL